MPKAQITPEQIEATKQALKNIPPRPVIDSPTALRVAEHFTDIYTARRNGIGWEHLITKYFHRTDERPTLRTMLRIFRALCEERGLPYQMERSPKMRERKVEREVHRVLARRYDHVHKLHDLEGSSWPSIIRDLFPHEETQPPVPIVNRVWAEIRDQRKKKKRKSAAQK